MMNKSGFTIIELIVVLAILSILIGIAGISGKAWLDRSRVETQMKELFVDLMNARVSAMQRSRLHIVTFSPSAVAATQYTIYEDTTDAAGNTVPDGDGELQMGSDRQIKQRNISSIYSMQTGAARIDFDQRGLASVLVGTQTVRVNGSFGAAYDCIVISLTRTRMGAWNAGTNNCDVQ